jgi:arylsulfatase A-like enzyme
MVDSPCRPIWEPALLGLAGAAAYGVFDVVRVALTGRLHPGPIALIALAVASVVGAGLLGALVAGTLGLAPPLRRRWRAWPFLAGLAVPLLASYAEVWFSDPPPFQEPWPFQGNPVVFLAAALIPIGLVIALARLAEGRAWIVAAIVALLAAIAAIDVLWLEQEGPPRLDGAGGTPNVLLVTLDTTRGDRFGGYGIDTAGFDRVASEGVRFDLAMSQIPVTGPSHATILSGRPPWENNMLLNGEPVRPDLPWLPKALVNEGYRTGAFVSAWVLMRNLGFSRDFHIFDDDFGWVKGFDALLPGRLIAMVDRRMQGAAYLLERRGDHTLFDAHGPYEPPTPYDNRYYDGADPRDPANQSMAQADHVPPYLASSLRGITDVDWVVAQYDGEVAYADTQLQRLLAYLDDAGIADSTLVIVTGDHGEGLGEEGEWFDHGDWLYEHDLHVPLAMRLPGRIPAGAIVDHPVELTDITPTIADYLELDIPGTTGVSLRGAIERGEIPHAMARSMAFDREPNRAARAEDPTFKPTWRQAGLRGPLDRYLHRDAAGYSPIYFSCNMDGCTRTDEIEVRKADLFQSAATTLLSTELGERAEKSSSEAAMLEALGYVDP